MKKQFTKEEKDQLSSWGRLLANRKHSNMTKAQESAHARKMVAAREAKRLDKKR